MKSPTPPRELPPQTPWGCVTEPLPLICPSRMNCALRRTIWPSLRMLFRFTSPLTTLAGFLLSEVAMTFGWSSSALFVPIWNVTPGSMVSTGGLLPAITSAYPIPG